MGVKWTEQQQKVIDLRNRNILVSAAAGSGKTAVLVERIIQKITDEQSPVDVDRLLIVTFTEAAAAEMKDRIREAIEKKLEENPGNVHLERQATLVHSAPITTIHSFCLSVIREHFHVIDLDPGFRIGEDGELKLLKQDVLDELLEECYSKGEEEFLSFTERFGTGKNDRKIEGIILKLYEYSGSYPRPEQWLDRCAAVYTEEEAAEAMIRRAKEHVLIRIEEPEKLIRRGLKICEEPDGPYMYADMLEEDLRGIEKIRKCSDFAEMYDAADRFVWKTLSRKKDDSVSAEKRESVKALREQAKKAIAGVKETYFYAPESVWKEDMVSAGESVKTLVSLVKLFAEKFAEKKRGRNMIDFNDMERFALDILTEEKNGELVPSAVAGEYAKQFEEIMIDEYQDSNFVQETILTSVSGQAEGKNNIFMVGDVKQSIYSFRLSRPELFMQKYNTYSLEDSDRQRIDLHKNFRSRGEVLDSVNYIFRRIMKKEMGGIEYDDSAALYLGAKFPKTEEIEAKRYISSECERNTDLFKTELLILKDRDKEAENVRRSEARMIARRIKSLMRGGVVSDKKTGEYRPVQYKDIVILTRSVKGWAEDFSAVLAEEGIPAYSVSREGYFETYEVSVLLDYLKILDNGRQDLPLAAVLASPLGNLLTEDMAKIRVAYPDVPFHESARMYASEEAQDPVLKDRLMRFFSQVDHFRKKVSYTPIHDLLTEIIEETGFGIYISAMEGGVQRAANVEMLVEKAKAFEGTSYKGLFHFVRYIEQLKKYDVDYGEAGIMDEQADTVRIMSIHKSKGLEFPVVFAAGMGKQFNTQDTKSSMILHPEWGIGIDKIDLKRRTKAPTFLKKLIREEAMYEMWAEEMRILYVALTRAKEKLIMTGVLPDRFIMRSGKDGVITAGAKSYFDWIIPALWSEEEAALEDAPVCIFQYTGNDIGADILQVKSEQLALDVLKHWDVTKVYDPEIRKCLDEQADYVYPYYSEGGMKMKFTVSELKKRKALQEEAGEEMYKEPQTVPLLPRFIKEEETLSGASRGSAYHKFLELLDFAKEYEADDLEAEVERLAEDGRLSREMAECIETEDMMRFLRTKSGVRMLQAARNRKLYKEQPFVISVDASKIYQGDLSGEKILVQGIIDVYFEEEDGLVVLDYKTDQVKSRKELAEKYHAQLEYYAHALSQLTGKTVKEKIIYSFTLKEEIIV